MPGAYRQIAVASTFSPRFLAVLAEADRFARSFGSPLSVIHAAPEHEEAIARFFEAFQGLHRENETGIIWSVADSPADAILDACARNEIDLLLAGALEREGDHRNFVGGVARELLQRSTCDLLLLPKPSEHPADSRRIAVEVDLKKPRVDFLNRACVLATRLGAAEMTFLGVVTPFDEALSSGPALDDAHLASIVDQADGFEGEVDVRLLRSTTGFAICDYLQDVGADLFVAGTGHRGNVRALPARLDWLQQVIPTNVLLVALEPDPS